MWIGIKDEIQSHNCHHHDDIAEDAHSIRDLMHQVEPFVDKTWGRRLQWLFQHFGEDVGRQGSENNPRNDEPKPKVVEAKADGHQPHTGQRRHHISPVLPKRGKFINLGFR